METVKKYTKNRKMYSTTLSRYVTVNYLLDLVRTNQKFQVIDSETKKDVTKKVLKTAIANLPLKMETITSLIKESNNEQV